MIIAIDGPSASGKGTLARKLATHLGLDYLDTGALYRAVALSVLNSGANPRDEKAAQKAAETLNLDILSDPHLRDEKMGEAASLVAAMPPVRAALLKFQRDFAENPPSGLKGVVIDGRDIGTVVCPDADFKLFVTASAEVRAKRRTTELHEKGRKVSGDEILQMVRMRDERDKSRKNSPLVQAEDAHLLDTTNLDIDGAFEKALDLFKASRI
ncbi:MAG: (d)CMP kinase [Alphaproteobacteria bacterium]